jgi:hypothetical protein
MRGLIFGTAFFFTLVVGVAADECKVQFAHYQEGLKFAAADSKAIREGYKIIESYEKSGNEKIDSYFEKMSKDAMRDFKYRLVSQSKKNRTIIKSLLDSDCIGISKFDKMTDLWVRTEKAFGN